MNEEPMTEMNAQRAAESPDQESTNAGHRPTVVFTGSGGLKVAVWKNKTETGEYYSVKLERRYKDKAEQWQSTESLRGEDLLRARELLGQADQWIEKDRQMQRGVREVG
jgi:hypothetical protein